MTGEASLRVVTTPEDDIDFCVRVRVALSRLEYGSPPTLQQIRDLLVHELPMYPEIQIQQLEPPSPRAAQGIWRVYRDPISA